MPCPDSQYEAGRAAHVNPSYVIAKNGLSPSSSGHPSSSRPRQYGYYTGSNESRSRRYVSSVYPGQNCPPSSQSRRMNFDANMNPIYDEAIQFVSASKRMLNVVVQKDEIYAEFVRKHFKCPLCRDVLIEATGLTCGHRFCRECIDTWLTTAPTCPVCENIISTCCRLYDIDNAIDSVSAFLSEDWKARRTFLNMTSRNQNSSIPEIPRLPSIHYPNQIQTERQLGGGSNLQFLKNAMHSTASGFCWTAHWLYDNIYLEELALGVLVICLGVLVLFFRDQVVNFTQYMYYAMINYKHNVPIELQIAAFQPDIDILGKSKYQPLSQPDTVFAKFIRSFYLGW